jgi:hypothetical protein
VDLWQILIICALMLPAFFALNYLVVKIAVRKMKERERRFEQAAAIGCSRPIKPRRRRKF